MGDITYQNKDVIAKSLADLFKGKTFSVYGIDVPEIVDVKPTNLPAVEANELRLDNLFLLKDGTFAIVDYESTYDEANKQKYLGYVARVAARIYNEYKQYLPIKVIIIYTADVSRRITKPCLDMGALKLELTEAFLVEQDSCQIYENVRRKLEQGTALDNEELMQFIIYPLTFKGNEAKQKAIERVIELVDKIENIDTRRFVARYLLEFTDKVINKVCAKRLRRMLILTQVEQIIEEEKIAAVNEAVSAAIDRTRREERNEARHGVERIVTNFLQRGDDIIKVSECTGLPIEDVRRIQEGLAD